MSLCGALSTVACNDRGEKPFGKFDRLRASSVIDVKGPAQGQPPITAHFCSLPKEFAKWVGVAPGDQVRIYRSADEYAVYTICELRNEISSTTVRMSKSGRGRLGTDELFVGQLDTQVTADELDDAEARVQSEFVERLVDDGVHSKLVVTAPHGGKIELNTDRQAEHVAALLPGVSSWICKGWRDPDGAWTRWHVRSEDLSPNSFAGLASIAHRGFKHAVSFHGMDAPGVIIGGRAPLSLREAVCDAIIDAIADPGVSVVASKKAGPHSGIEPANFVNWLTADGESGIQIEQSTPVRNMYWLAIAEAVAEVLGPLL